MGDPEKEDNALDGEHASAPSTPVMAAEEEQISDNKAIPNPGNGVLNLSIVGDTPWLT